MNRWYDLMSMSDAIIIWHALNNSANSAFTPDVAKEYRRMADEIKQGKNLSRFLEMPALREVA